MMRRSFVEPRENQEFVETVIDVNRVSKKTKGGNQMRFSALVVVGDRKGRVGVGHGRARNVVSAIRKAIGYAQKRLVTVPVVAATIPFQVRVKYGAAQILLKPAREGSGIVAGGPLRVLFEAAGVRDVVGKILGSDNKTANLYAALEAIKRLNTLVERRRVLSK